MVISFYFNLIYKYAYIHYFPFYRHLAYGIESPSNAEEEKPVDRNVPHVQPDQLRHSTVIHVMRTTSTTKEPVLMNSMKPTSGHGGISM